jgi:hypothetical protein
LLLPRGLADGTQPSQAPPESYDLMVSCFMSGL